MNDTVVQLATIFGVAVVVYALVALVQRKRGRGTRRKGSRQSATGQTTAVHLPADDPHWLAYSKRLEAQPESKRARRADRARRRQKSTAAWSAGAVAGGSNEFGGSGCGGGGSSCGGGGCGGGGCGGG
jgi:Flp pilus assembly protein TadB